MLNGQGYRIHSGRRFSSKDTIADMLRNLFYVGEGGLFVKEGLRGQDVGEVHRGLREPVVFEDLKSPLPAGDRGGWVKKQRAIPRRWRRSPGWLSHLASTLKALGLVLGRSYHERGRRAWTLIKCKMPRRG